MTFNHTEKNLHAVIGINQEDLDEYFGMTMWKNFETIKNGNDITDDVLAQVLVHLIGVYNEYDNIMMPLMGSIYGFKTKEFKDIFDMEVSHQIESVVRFADKQLRRFIGGYYMMTLLNDNGDDE